MVVGIGNQLLAHATTVPGRLTQHVVESLVMAARHGFGHLLHIAPVALEEPMQVEARCVFDRAGAALEASLVGCEVGIEMSQCGCDQASNAIRVFELTL